MKASQLIEAVVNGANPRQLLTEVRVDTSNWDREHLGTKKQSGGWMFSFVDPRGKDIRKLETFSHNGPYSEAVKKAQEAAKQAGYNTVYVLS